MCGSYSRLSDKTLQNQRFEEIFLQSVSLTGVRRDFVIRDFCWPWRKKYPEKVTSSTIQMDISFFMFLAQFLAKKKIFLTRAEVLIFSRENGVEP